MQEVFPSMRSVFMLLIPLSLLAAASWYLSYRLYQGLAAFFPGIRFWPVLVLILALLLILVLAFMRALTPFSKEFKRILGLAGGYCMGFVLYLLLFTVAANLLMLLPRLLKLPFTAHRLFHGFVTAGVLLLTLSTCLYGFLHVHNIRHESYEIPLQGKADISDLNVVMISDLHLGAVGSEERLEKVVEEINALQPDVLCIAGDFFDTDFAAIQNPDAALKTLQKLHATYGIYACLGNHDGGATLPQMTAFLEEAGICLLDDTYTIIDRRLVLVGRLDASAIGGYGERKRQPLSDILTCDNPALPVIVLDHNPAHISEYGSEADLILCGHTHKGQVFPGNLFTKKLYTVDYGYYRKDAQSPHVIVTSGVGAWGMPMRVGTNCEIVSIRFSCEP